MTTGTEETVEGTEIDPGTEIDQGTGLETTEDAAEGTETVTEADRALVIEETGTGTEEGTTIGTDLQTRTDRIETSPAVETLVRGEEALANNNWHAKFG